MSLLEIVKPAAQRRIQFDDNFRQTIPARALGPHPDAIVHGLKTLAPHPASPHFEVIAQKVKPCPHCRQSPTWVFSALRLSPLTSRLLPPQAPLGLLQHFGTTPQSHPRIAPSDSPSAPSDHPGHEGRCWPKAD